MRRLTSVDPLAGLFLLAGGFLVYQSLRLSMRSLDGGPGPGLLPAALGVLALLFSGRVLLAGAPPAPTFGNLVRVGFMVAALALFAAGMETLGFVLTSSIAMVGLLVLFNERRRGLLALLGVAGAVVAYALFYVVLKVQLPPDPWGLWR